MPSCPLPSAADLYRGTSEAIPTSVWSVGDDPEDGKVHVVIDVSGAKHRYATVTDPISGRLVRKEYDAHISFDSEGTHPIEDPSHVGRRQVYGYRLDNRCDGNNQMMRLLGCSIQDESSRCCLRRDSRVLGKSQGSRSSQRICASLWE